MKFSLRRLSPFFIAVLAGVSASAIAIIVVASNQSDSNESDVILDQPGVYQEPGIGTNAPVVGKQM